jgi:hypothetical protein
MNNLKIAFRQSLKHPGFCVIVIFSHYETKLSYSNQTIRLQKGWRQKAKQSRDLHAFNRNQRT